MKSKKLFVILFILSVISLIGTAVIYTKLPQTIPTHWGFDGKVNGYGDRSTVFVLGLLPLLTCVMFWGLPKIDPKKASYLKHEKAYGIMTIITVVFTIIMDWSAIFQAMGKEMHIGQIIPLLVGIMLIVIGNYMPQVRQNYFMGIKTPWTLDNPYVWKKTHKMGGIVFCIMGIATMLASVAPARLMGPLLPLVVFGGTVFLYVYSYLVFKKGEN